MRELKKTVDVDGREHTIYQVSSSLRFEVCDESGARIGGFHLVWGQDGWLADPDRSASRLVVGLATTFAQEVNERKIPI